MKSQVSLKKMTPQLHLKMKQQLPRFIFANTDFEVIIVLGGADTQMNFTAEKLVLEASLGLPANIKTSQTEQKYYSELLVGNFPCGFERDMSCKLKLRIREASGRFGFRLCFFVKCTENFKIETLESSAIDVVTDPPTEWLDGPAEQLDEMLNQSPNLLNCQDSRDSGWRCRGRSALIYAAEKGRKDCVQVLLNAGADTDLQDKNGHTALMCCVDEECISLILQSNANSELVDTGGKTALFLAFEKRRLACLKLLLEASANIDHQVWGWTVLMRAAAQSDKHLMKILLGACANTDVQNMKGYTALILATLNGHEACVKLLIDAKANSNLQDKKGRTALIYAAQDGHEACVQHLLEAKANPDLQDSAGCTALMSAAQYNYLSSCELLVHHRADVNLKNMAGRTALMTAKAFGNAETASFIAYSTDNSQEADLLSKGCYGTMYVCRKDALFQMEKMLTCEEAVSLGYVLQYPGSGTVLFLSQRWLGSTKSPPHPDNDNNQKLNAIKIALNHHTDFISVVYVWIDYLCIPQCVENCFEQLLAINSLPYVIQQCSHFVVLVGESGLCNSQMEDEGCLNVYLSRGWCRLELLSAIALHLSQSDQFVAWECSMNTGEVKILDSCLDSFNKCNPFTGDFTNPNDKQRISLAVLKLCDLLEKSYKSNPEITKIKELAFHHYPMEDTTCPLVQKYKVRSASQKSLSFDEPKKQQEVLQVKAEIITASASLTTLCEPETNATSPFDFETNTTAPWESEKNTTSPCESDTNTPVDQDQNGCIIT